MRWVEFGVALPKKNRLCPQKPPITRWSWKSSTGMSWDISTSPACCMCDGTWGSQRPQGPQMIPTPPHFSVCPPWFLDAFYQFLSMLSILSSLFQDFFRIVQDHLPTPTRFQLRCCHAVAAAVGRGHAGSNGKTNFKQHPSSVTVWKWGRLIKRQF